MHSWETKICTSSRVDSIAGQPSSTSPSTRATRNGSLEGRRPFPPAGAVYPDPPRCDFLMMAGALRAREGKELAAVRGSKELLRGAEVELDSSPCRPRVC